MSKKKHPEQRSNGSDSVFMPESPARNGFTRLLFEKRTGLILLFALLMAECAFFRIALFRYFIEENDIPSYIFAAETLALGKLKVDIPPPDHPDERKTDDAPQFFRTFMVVPHTFDDRKENGEKYRHMYTRYPPGHPLVLMAGKFLLRSYQLVPFLILAGIAAGVYCILKLCWGVRTARWGLVIVSGSPFLVSYGSTLLSHGTTVLFIAFATLCYFRMDRAHATGSRFALGFFAAALYGAAVATRPFDGTLMIIAVIIWELLHLKKNGRQILVRWGSMTLGGALVLSGLLWYNAYFTDNPLHFPFNQYWARDSLGFTGLTERDISEWSPSEREAKLKTFKGEDVLGHQMYRYQEHTPWLGLRNVIVLLGEFNRFFLVLPAGLVILLCLLIWGRQMEFEYRWFHLLQFGLIVTGYFCYFSRSDHSWGPRYYYSALLPAILLLAPLLSAVAARISMPVAHWRVIAAAIIGIVFLHTFSTCYKGYKYQRKCDKQRRKIVTNIEETVRASEKTPAIVFLPVPVVDRADGMFWYVGFRHGHLLNSPTFDDPILYAVNNGLANSVLYNHPRYHDRKQNMYELRHNGSVVRIAPVKQDLTSLPGTVKEFPPAVWTNADGVEFARIPAGKFAMGTGAADRNAHPNEFPQHLVRISTPFLMAKRETTVRQFRSFVKATGHKTIAEQGTGAYLLVNGTWSSESTGSWKKPGFVQGDNHPVTCVMFDDAVAYTQWLNTSCDSKPDGWEYRLPSEAEWEYAARGADSRAYPWGSEWRPGRANALVGRRPEFTRPVGSSSPKGDSPFGIADLSGNVSEWVADWHSLRFYAKSRIDDPANLGMKTLHLLRGGSWADPPRLTRAAFRSPHYAGNCMPIYGIRVVLAKKRSGSNTLALKGRDAAASSK